MKSVLSLALISGAAAAVASTGSVPLDSSVMNSAAYQPFQKSQVVHPVSKGESKRQTVVPDEIYVLQCTEAGFRGNCLVFGAPPGQCVSYSSFGNDSSLIDTFQDKVLSIAVNTGGDCMFYHYEGCDALGNDRGLTSSYNYDLSVALPSDPRTVEYAQNITSWRC